MFLKYWNTHPIYIYIMHPTSAYYILYIQEPISCIC